jgi:hypothetical protein
MNDIEIRYESVRFDGSFMNKSIYQQSAGPEVDEAWSGLGIDCEIYRVPLVKLRLTSTSPYCCGSRRPWAGSLHGSISSKGSEIAGRWLSDQRGGSTPSSLPGKSFLPSVWTTFQKCQLLQNMIRQTLPWNVDYYRDRGAGVYENSEPIVQLHVGEYQRPSEAVDQVLMRLISNQKPPAVYMRLRRALLKIALRICDAGRWKTLRRFVS